MSRNYSPHGQSDSSWNIFETLPFPRFLQEFLKGQIVLLVTNVKQTRKIVSNCRLIKSKIKAKSSKVKLSQKCPFVACCLLTS